MMDGQLLGRDEGGYSWRSTAHHAIITRGSVRAADWSSDQRVCAFQRRGSSTLQFGVASSEMATIEALAAAITLFRE